MQTYGALQGLSSRIPMVRLPSTLRMAAFLAMCAGLFALTSLEPVNAVSPGRSAADAAQTQAPVATTAAEPAKRTVHPRKRPAAKPTPALGVVASAPLVPAAPPAPDWPANDRPRAAAVVWDSQGLKVDASNSSLGQILKDVSMATGAKLEGFSADQRVFGNYGPGTAREVLSQLLEGSGYNVMLIGDQGEGTPREIVLSSKPSGPAPIAGPGQPANTVADEEPDAVPETPTQPYRSNMPPFAAPPEMRNDRQGLTPLQQLQQQPQNPPYGPPNNPQQ